MCIETRKEIVEIVGVSGGCTYIASLVSLIIEFLLVSFIMVSSGSVEVPVHC